VGLDLASQWMLSFFAACLAGLVVGWLVARFASFEVGLGVGLLLPGLVRTGRRARAETCGPPSPSSSTTRDRHGLVSMAPAAH